MHSILSGLLLATFLTPLVVQEVHARMDHHEAVHVDHDYHGPQFSESVAEDLCWICEFSLSTLHLPTFKSLRLNVTTGPQVTQEVPAETWHSHIAQQHHAPRGPPGLG